MRMRRLCQDEDCMPDIGTRDEKHIYVSCHRLCPLYPVMDVLCVFLNIYLILMIYIYAAMTTRFLCPNTSSLSRQIDPDYIVSCYILMGVLLWLTCLVCLFTRI